MKLLLDTHIFLWFLGDDKRLSSTWAYAVRSRDNDVYVSVASIWESMVKHRMGKLPLPIPPEKYLTEGRTLHGIRSLALDEASVLRLAEIPYLHSDPFDRMLICQALEHRMTLVTVDPLITSYPIPVLQ